MVNYLFFENLSVYRLNHVNIFVSLHCSPSQKVCGSESTGLAGEGRWGDGDVSNGEVGKEGGWVRGAGL